MAVKVVANIAESEIACISTSVKSYYATTRIARTTTNIVRTTNKEFQDIEGILVVSSNPRRDLDNIREETENLVKSIKKELEEVKIKEVSDQQATKENVIRELETGKYQVLHYSGHSGYNPEDPGQSYLLLCRENRHMEESKLIADELARLSVEGNLRLVFLNSCYSGKSGGLDEGVMGLADSFVRAGVPFVIGMMWRITDDGGLLLAKEFYRQLMKTKDPIGALSKARIVVGYVFNWEDPTWAAPVIYTQ